MPLKRSQWDIYSGQLPLLLQAELSGTSCRPFPWWPPAGSHSWLSPNFGTALGGSAIPWPGISECPGRRPGLAEDFGCCGLRAIFTVLCL